MRRVIEGLQFLGEAVAGGAEPLSAAATAASGHGVEHLRSATSDMISSGVADEVAGNMIASGAAIAGFLGAVNEATNGAVPVLDRLNTSLLRDTGATRAVRTIARGFDLADPLQTHTPPLMAIGIPTPLPMPHQNLHVPQAHVRSGITRVHSLPATNVEVREVARSLTEQLSEGFSASAQQTTEAAFNITGSSTNPPGQMSPDTFTRFQEHIHMPSARANVGRSLGEATQGDQHQLVDTMDQFRDQVVESIRNNTQELRDFFFRSLLNIG